MRVWHATAWVTIIRHALFKEHPKVVLPVGEHANDQQQAEVHESFLKGEVRCKDNVQLLTHLSFALHMLNFLIVEPLLDPEKEKDKESALEMHRESLTFQGLQTDHVDLLVLGLNSISH